MTKNGNGNADDVKDDREGEGDTKEREREKNEENRTRKKLVTNYKKFSNTTSIFKKYTPLILTHAQNEADRRTDDMENQRKTKKE